MDTDCDESNSNESIVIDLYELETEKLNNRVKISNALCTVTLVSYSLATAFYSIWPCTSTEEPDKYYQANRLTTSITFFVLGTAFLFIGVTMNYQLR